MRTLLHVERRSRRVFELAALCILSLVAIARAPAAPPATALESSPAARAAIANRKAIFTLIGSNFRPIAEVLRQGAASRSLDTGKYSQRVAMLADFLPEAFPDISSTGDTRARVEIWSHRADFEKLLRDFHDHTVQLAQAASRHDNDAFKTIAGSVAQDCKACHDRYRAE
jgi:cytochrome c556